ncbi:XdhC family protein [Nocardia asteroides]|uniref:XdhC family protein n=1 Tax=Nocardia asteroides TaxID=1824 RepID=UPI001E443B75|nr:XdhC/CoxI family protein [Nocardia asteroides]UGT64710.1 XdhC family protein [Nocardia asteroides]
MRDIVDDLLRVWHSGRTGGLATIVRAVGSTSLPVGAATLIDPEGGVFGSIASGRLEEAVFEGALRATRTGHRALHRFDVLSGVETASDGDETVDIFIEPFSRWTFPEFPTVAAEIAAHRRVTVFTVVWNPDPDVIGQHLITDKKHATELVALPESDVFVSSFSPPPRLIVFGANAYAAALTAQARLIGCRVTICDSRPEFAVPESFPGAEVVCDWPHRYLNTLAAQGEIESDTGIVVLAHEPKFEIPLLTVALRLPELGYLAALGSATAHGRRLDDLRAGGFDERTLAKLHIPAGLTMGARNPAETAVFITAELLAARGGQAERRSSWSERAAVGLSG